jgi:hypothetical protein
MRMRTAGIVAVAFTAALLLGGCGRTGTEDAGGNELSTVEPIEGSDVLRVTLTEDAAARIDVQTAAVQTRSVGSERRLQIPYAAVLYDPNGDTWTYTNPEPLVFIRAPIDILHIDGGRAVLTSGPAAGTDVVTVGAAELLGTEYEVGEE